MSEKSIRPQRFIVSLLALTSFGSYNKRVCGLPRSPKLPYRATSHTRQTLSEMPAVDFKIDMEVKP